MSSPMVTVVLKITLGLFVKKARSLLSKKLAKGGLTSRKLGDLIRSSLQNIKTTLVGLARKDLLTSASSIQEGLEIFPNGEAWWPYLVHRNSRNNDPLLDIDSYGKLVEEVNELKLKYGKSYSHAMKKFYDANTDAGKAFNTDGLKLEDHILATKLRIISIILLNLDNPNEASGPCRFYLEELHRLAPLVVDFRDFLEGGVMSYLNREKRKELVLSVVSTNLVVFTFLKNFTKCPVNLYNWPNLNNRGWEYNPLIPTELILMTLQGTEVEFPNLVVFRDIPDGGIMERHELQAVTVNSIGDKVIVGSTPLLSNRVTLRHFTKDKITTNDLSVYGITSQHLLHLVTDNNDNKYVLTDSSCTASGGRSILLERCHVKAFDSSGNPVGQITIGDCTKVKLMVPTPCGFAVSSENTDATTAIEFYENREGRIRSTHCIQTKLWEDTLIAVTDTFQVVAVEQNGYHFRVHDKDGKPLHERELYGGKREQCFGIAFNFVAKELVFLSLYVGGWYLSTYEPESGRRIHYVRLWLFDHPDEKILLTSHCNGSMALVSPMYILYIQTII